MLMKINIFVDIAIQLQITNCVFKNLQAPQFKLTNRRTDILNGNRNV